MAPRQSCWLCLNLVNTPKLATAPSASENAITRRARSGANERIAHPASRASPGAIDKQYRGENSLISLNVASAKYTAGVKTAHAVSSTVFGRSATQ